MPIIRVEMLEGRSVEQKRELAAALTRELSRICLCNSDSVTVVIDDVAKTNWASGGVLQADKLPSNN